MVDSAELERDWGWDSSGDSVVDSRMRAAIARVITSVRQMTAEMATAEEMRFWGLGGSGFSRVSGLTLP